MVPARRPAPGFAADDDNFLRAVDRCLDPVRRAAARPVRPGQAFRDDAFEAAMDRSGGHLRWIHVDGIVRNLDDVTGQPQRSEQLPALVGAHVIDPGSAHVIGPTPVKFAGRGVAVGFARLLG
jgi:hypothetical protein